MNKIGISTLNYTEVSQIIRCIGINYQGLVDKYFPNTPLGYRGWTLWNRDKKIAKRHGKAYLDKEIAAQFRFRNWRTISLEEGMEEKTPFQSHLSMPNFQKAVRNNETRIL